MSDRYIPIALVSGETMEEAKARLIETERTAAHVRLAQAMTHELRNPIMVVGSMIRRIIRTNPAAASGETYEALMSSIERMETVLKDMDEFISIPVPNLKLQRIDRLIREELKGYTSQWQEKSVYPILSIRTPNVRAPVDHYLLRKAFSVIFKEIVFALPQESILPVVVSVRGKEIEILFGEASPRECFCDLYDARLKSKHWSMSLYLSAAHKILTDHGGKLLFDADSRTILPILVKIPRLSILK